MKKAALVEIISILFILLFTYAAVSKLLDYRHFRIEMGKSPVLAGISGWLAWILPVTEMIIAVILCGPKIRWVGLYLSLTLMTMFTTYLITILKFSAFVPCTCGGLLEKMSWNTHIGFNIFFIALALLAILFLPEQKTFSKKNIPVKY